jgi:hypothetical protein
VSFAVILQLKLCLKYFIRNIHGYPWIYPLSNLLDISMDIHGYGYPLQGSAADSKLAVTITL